MFYRVTETTRGGPHRRKTATTVGALASLTTMLTIGLLPSIGQTSAAFGSTPSATTMYKIGMVVGDTTQSGQSRVWKAAAKEAKRLGNVDLIVLNSNRDASTEASNMNELIAEHVKLVMDIPVDVKGSVPVLQRVQAANIPVITVLDSVVGSGTKFRYVGSDFLDGAGAGLEAQTLATALHGTGNVVLLNGQPGVDVTNVRKAAYAAVFAHYPRIHVVYQQYCPTWSSAAGETLMLAALTKYPNAGSINGVIGANEDIALGAIQAMVRDNRLKGVISVGLDGNPNGLKSILNNQLTYDVFQNMEVIGKTAVDEAVGILQGKSEPVKVNVPWVLINTKAIAAHLLSSVFGMKP